MRICKCDICGRVDGAYIEHYKLKKEVYNWYEKHWEYLDMCDLCLNEIREKVREKIRLKQEKR